MQNNSVVVIFKICKRNQEFDIEIPLYISANDLVIALNIAFDLGINVSDIKNCYLKAEKPIALLKGNKLLAEFGIRDGSTIMFTE